MQLRLKKEPTVFSVTAAKITQYFITNFQDICKNNSEVTLPKG
jgi:hypothetical protein